MSIDLSTTAQAIIKSPMISFFDNRYEERYRREYLLLKLLHDPFIKRKIHNLCLLLIQDVEVKHVRSNADLDCLLVDTPGFNFDNYKQLSDSFSDCALYLMVELEAEIMLIFNHKNEIIIPEGVVVKKRVVKMILQKLLEKMARANLLRSDYRTIPKHGFLRMNFCRWVLVSYFVTHEQAAERTIFFKGDLSKVLPIIA